MYKNTFEGKRVLVTGGTGMVGIQLVKLLIDRGAQVRIVSMDKPDRAHPDAEFIRADLTRIDNCEKACNGMNYVFHVAGIKGSPKVTGTQPASFFVPTIMFNTNMAEAARRANADWYLYTSTVGVYAPAEVFKEDTLWDEMPSPHDWYAGWAKRMGELQLDAYETEFQKHNSSIVRPVNIYGPWDNFDPANSMVIPSLIKRALDKENPYVVWGDGTPVRDFIHARDVARAMMFVVENKVTEPVNLGSGKGIMIKELVEIILNNLPERPQVEFDTTKPRGDERRVADVSRLRGYGFENEVTFEAGIKDVMEWYKEHVNDLDVGYNVFTQNK